MADFRPTPGHTQRPLPEPDSRRAPPDSGAPLLDERCIATAFSPERRTSAAPRDGSDVPRSRAPACGYGLGLGEL